MVGSETLMIPTGLSQPSETRGNTQPDQSAVSWAVSSLQEGDEQAEELLTLWQSLDAAGRADLLIAARGIAGGHP